MCGGGSSQSSTNTYQPPQQVLDNYGMLSSAAENLVNRPEQQYGGSMVAGFTPQQLEAFQTINNAQGIAQPYINSAAQEIGKSTANLWDGPVTGQDIQNYESPYTNQVTQALQNTYNQQNKQAVEQVAGNATTHGAYGGDREAIAEAMTEQQMALPEEQNLAQVRQQGYNTALGEANTEQQTKLGANQANAWLASQAGYGLANLGNEAQSTALTGANANLQAGADQQQLAQEQLNVPYEEFQAQQAYPYQQLSWLSGIYGNAAGAVGGTTTSTQPTASPFSSALGAGLAGYGIANSIGSGGLSGVSPVSSYSYAPMVQNTGGITPTTVSSYGSYAHGGRIHHDAGGIAGGNPGVPMLAVTPMAQNAMSQYSQMPDEKLQELTMRTPPNSPQGQMLQRVIRQRRMNPNQAGIAAASQQVSGGGMNRGGAVFHRHLASGGKGGGPDVTYITGGNGVAIPQMSGISATSVPAGSSGYGLAGAFNPLSQIKNTAPNIVTNETGAIKNGIKDPVNFSTPTAATLEAMNNNGSNDWASGLGALAGIGLSFLKSGGRAHHADGDAVGDDDYSYDDDMGMGGGSAPTPAAVSGIAASAPQFRGAPKPSPSSDEIGSDHQYQPNINEALIRAGFGIMAGRSPNTANNIGAGGLEALNDLDHQRQWDAQQQDRHDRLLLEQQRDAAQEKHFDDMDKKPVIDHSGKTVQVLYPSELGPDGKPKVVDLGIPTTSYTEAQTRDAHDKAMESIDRARLGVEQANAGRGYWEPAQALKNPDGTPQKDANGAPLATWVNRYDVSQTKVAPMPDQGMSGYKAAGGATAQLASQMVADGSAKNIEEALTKIHDPSGHYAAQVNQSAKNTALTAARSDPEYQNDPTGTVKRWNAFYGVGDQRPTASAQPPASAGQQSSAAPAPTDPLAMARQAIAQGADRNAVIDRLKQAGIDPSGL